MDSFPREDWPVVFLVFWSFRLMVGLGLLMIGLGAWGLWLWLRGRLETDRWFLRACVAMSPAGFLAVLSGWITAEVGRQPYVAYGVLRTAQAASPIGAGEVGTSLAAFMIIYAIVFTAGAIFIFRLLHEGPETAAGSEPPMGPRAPGTPLAKAPEDESPGGPDDAARGGLRGAPA
jgi:cytochrome d ubiquinol oxidase subunit I